MKKIEVITSHGKLSDLYAALAKTEYPGLIVYETECINRQIGIEQELRKMKGRNNLITKTKIEIIAGDDDIDRLVDTIYASGAAGDAGDDRVFICTVEKPARLHGLDQKAAVSQ
jgi:nitrogen regulatory protein P-II 1